MKIHTQTEMGSAALVPYPGKVTEFPIRDTEVLKKYIKKIYTRCQGRLYLHKDGTKHFT